MKTLKKIKIKATAISHAEMKRIKAGGITFGCAPIGGGCSSENSGCYIDSAPGTCRTESAAHLYDVYEGVNYGVWQAKCKCELH